MTEAEQEKPCIRLEYILFVCRILRSKWTRRLVIAGAAIFSFMYYLDKFRKPEFYPHEMAVRIAFGYYNEENGYSLDYRKMPLELQKPTCKSLWKSNKEKVFSYFTCVNIHGRSLDSCGFFREQGCLIFETSAYLLSEPDKMGKVVDALFNHCKYLLSPEKIESLHNPEYARRIKKDEESIKKELKFLQELWKEGGCDDPDSIWHRAPIYLLFLEGGTEIARMVRNSRP